MELREHRPGLDPDARWQDRTVHRIRGLANQDVVHILVITLVLVAVSLYLTVATDRFLTTPNLVAILQTMAVLCIASIGQTLVLLIGGFDLSVGGVIPLAGVVYAVVANSTDGAGGVLRGVAAACAVGVAFGLLNGVLVTKLQINPLITTLATMSLAGGAAFLFNDGITTVLMNPDATVFSASITEVVSWDVVIVIAVALGAAFVLHMTVAGRIVYALGGNAEAVRRSGIRADRAMISVYVASGLLAAVAGVVATSQLSAASPDAYSDAALTTVTAVVLGGTALTGGRGLVLGTVIGSLLLGVIANGLNLLQVDTFYQTIVTGVVLLLAVVLTKLRDVFSSSAS